MRPVVEHTIEALERETDPYPLHDAVLNAGFLFEKARGFPPCAWPDEVIQAVVTDEDMRRLRNAMVAFVEREGFGSWALGKCACPTLKPVLIRVLRRHVDDDAGELFQAMIALDRLGEPVFVGNTSRSILDEAHNRALVWKYLKRV